MKRRDDFAVFASGFVIVYALGIGLLSVLGLHCTPLPAPVPADSGWHTATVPTGWDGGTGALR